MRVKCDVIKHDSARKMQGTRNVVKFPLIAGVENRNETMVSILDDDIYLPPLPQITQHTCPSGKSSD